MTVKISHTAAVQSFFKEAAGFASDNGNPRLKSIILRVLQDSAKIIEDLDISEDEFWKSVDYLNRLGARSEAGLLVAGLGIEHLSTCCKTPRTSRPARLAAPRAPSKARCMWPGLRCLKARRGWTMAAKRVPP